MSDTMSDPAGRITEWLALGGLFNPELMPPDKTRDLMIDSRDEINAMRSRLAEATELLARAEDDLGEWERVYESVPETTRLRLEIMGFRAAGDSATYRESDSHE